MAQFILLPVAYNRALEKTAALIYEYVYLPYWGKGNDQSRYYPEIDAKYDDFIPQREYEVYDIYEYYGGNEFSSSEPLG